MYGTRAREASGALAASGFATDSRLLRGSELRALARELVDRPAIVLVDRLGRPPRLHALHLAALHHERLTTDRAVGGREIRDKGCNVGRIPHVEALFGWFDHVAEARRRFGETRACARCDCIRTDAVARQLLRTHLREGCDATLG